MPRAGAWVVVASVGSLAVHAVAFLAFDAMSLPSRPTARTWPDSIEITAPPAEPNATGSGSGSDPRPRPRPRPRPISESRSPEPPRSRSPETHRETASIDPFATDGVATEHGREVEEEAATTVEVEEVRDVGGSGSRDLGVSGTGVSGTGTGPGTGSGVRTGSGAGAGAGAGAGREGIAGEVVRDQIESVVRYPRLAREMQIEGTVTVRFRIDSRGGVSDIRILTPVHDLLDAEAVRAVKAAAPLASPPGWVRVPVRFGLTPAP